MRGLLLTAAIGVAAAALYPSAPARAWWDHWGRWHPAYYGPRYVAPPPPPVVYVAPRPYAHWVSPHHDRWGRFVRGHWA